MCRTASLTVLYLSGYSCMCVLTTSAGWVTTDAKQPATKPQEKWTTGL